MSESNEPKAILRINDGLRMVCIDPMAAYRKLNHLCGGDVEEVYKNTRKGVPVPPDDLPPEQREQWEAANPESKQDEPTRFQAYEILLPAIREAFGMAPWNRETGEGADDVDCMQALYDYIDFAEKKNRSSGTMPTSAPLSDGGLWKPAPPTPPIEPMPPPS